MFNLLPTQLMMVINKHVCAKSFLTVQGYRRNVQAMVVQPWRGTRHNTRVHLKTTGLFKI